MDIVCTGSIAYDYLMTFPGYFRDHILPEQINNLSLSFLVDSMVRQRGGIAPNIAYTLALLGGKPRMVGTVGQDFGDYRAWLDEMGIDTRNIVTIPDKFTASFFVNTDLSNAQIASFYTGAMANSADLSLLKIEGGKPEFVVISPNDPDAMNRYVIECRENGIDYLYDPSQQVVRLPAEDLRRGVEGAKALFVNEYEFGLLQKHTGLTADEIRQRVGFTVVTLGAEGSCIYADGKSISVPVVPPTTIVDPTGVGDAYRGGFLTGYRMGWDWEICGRLGALAACYVLEQRGTQSHYYTREQFVARYREHFDDHGLLDALLK